MNEWLGKHELFWKRLKGDWIEGKGRGEGRKEGVGKIWEGDSAKGPEDRVRRRKKRSGRRKKEEMEERGRDEAREE